MEERKSHQGHPDSPQRPLRAEALRRGITVFVATPRLRGGFRKLDPRCIPPDKIEEAASWSRGDRWSEEVALTNMPGLEAIVCGSVAVTRDGRRCGKGEGYSDLEFAILRELGYAPVPVATTVHDLLVGSVLRDPTEGLHRSVVLHLRSRVVPRCRASVQFHDGLCQPREPGEDRGRAALSRLV